MPHKFAAVQVSGDETLANLLGANLARSSEEEGLTERGGARASRSARCSCSATSRSCSRSIHVRSTFAGMRTNDDDDASPRVWDVNIWVPASPRPRGCSLKRARRRSACRSRLGQPGKRAEIRHKGLLMPGAARPAVVDGLSFPRSPAATSSAHSGSARAFRRNATAGTRSRCGGVARPLGSAPSVQAVAAVLATSVLFLWISSTQLWSTPPPIIDANGLEPVLVDPARRGKLKLGPVNRRTLRGSRPGHAMRPLLGKA